MTRLSRWLAFEPSDAVPTLASVVVVLAVLTASLAGACA